MKDQLKETIEKSRKKIQEVTDEIDNKSEKLSSDTKDLWHQAKSRLSEIGDKLDEASSHLGTKTDEAALQAHLAAMEAHDKWQNMSQSFEKISQQTVNQAKSELDHAALQSHLAKMDAETFMESTGNAIVHNFNISRNKIENTTISSVKEMEAYFNKIANSIRRNDSE